MFRASLEVSPAHIIFAVGYRARQEDPGCRCEVKAFLGRQGKAEAILVRQGAAKGAAYNRDRMTQLILVQSLFRRTDGGETSPSREQAARTSMGFGTKGVTAMVASPKLPSPLQRAQGVVELLS